jgi:hypothetical protein
MDDNEELEKSLQKQAGELQEYAIKNADTLSDSDLNKLYKLIIDMDSTTIMFRHMESDDDALTLWNIPRRELSDILLKRGLTDHIRVFNVDTKLVENPEGLLRKAVDKFRRKVDNG